MTGFISAVNMSISRLSTLMTASNDLFGDTLPQPVIKNKVLALKLQLQSFFLCLVGIIDNATFQVKHIFKSLVQHVSTSLFTPDTPGTIHNNILITGIFQHVCSHG